MKNKKYLCIFLLVISLFIVVICIFFKKSNNSIIGTWTIDHHISDEILISNNEIADYYGADYKKLVERFAITFSNSKSGIIILTSYSDINGVEGKIKYSISGKEINIQSDGDETQEIIKLIISGDEIIINNTFNLIGTVAIKKNN